MKQNAGLVPGEWVSGRDAHGSYACGSSFAMIVSCSFVNNKSGGSLGKGA